MRLVSLIPSSWPKSSILKLTIDMFIMSSNKSGLNEEFNVLSVFFTVDCPLACFSSYAGASMDSSKTLTLTGLSIDFSISYKSGSSTVTISSVLLSSTTGVVSTSSS